MFSVLRKMKLFRSGRGCPPSPTLARPLTVRGIIIIIIIILQDYGYTSNSNNIAKLRDHQVVCQPLGQRCCYHDFIESLWTNPDSTFRMIVSLSIQIVFCSSNLILSHKSSFSNIFSSSFNISLRPPLKVLITSGTTLNLNPNLLSYFECKLPVIGSLFQSLLFYIVLLRAYHITCPYSFRLLLFKHQIWPSRCCRFS